MKFLKECGERGADGLNDFLRASESVNLLILSDKLASFKLGLSQNQQKVGIEGLHSIFVKSPSLIGLQGCYKISHLFSDCFKNQIVTEEAAFNIESLNCNRLSGLRG